MGFLHGVRGEFTDDVSETAVGPIFTGHELEREWAASHSVAHLHPNSWPVKDGTHSDFRNVVSKFTSHTVQQPQNQETVNSYSTAIFSPFLCIKQYKTRIDFMRIKSLTQASVWKYTQQNRRDDGDRVGLRNVRLYKLFHAAVCPRKLYDAFNNVSRKCIGPVVKGQQFRLCSVKW